MVVKKRTSSGWQNIVIICHAWFISQLISGGSRRAQQIDSSFFLDGLLCLLLMNLTFSCITGQEAA